LSTKLLMHAQYYKASSYHQIVKEYKCLGTIIDDNLKGSSNVKNMCKKANQRVYFQRKLKDVNMDKTILNLFYKSVFQSVVRCCIICYFGNK
jgi:DUF917 family protein